MTETAADKAREETLVADAEAALKRLAEERGRIQTPDEDEKSALAEAVDRLTAANAAVEALDAQLTALTEQAANDEARRAALEHKVTDLKQRKERLATRSRAIIGQRDQLLKDTPEASSLEEAERRLAETRAGLDHARRAAEEAGKARAEAVEAATGAATGARTASAAASRLKAEVEALSEVLDADDQEQWPPVFDSLGVDAGYEAALAVALGEDLTASDDEAAPSHWRALGAMNNPPALPGGARPLSDFVRGPAALGRRLSQIGVLDDEADARRLTGELAQGQRLVSRSGGLWRWDGYTVSPAAATASQARLEQRKRLKTAREKLTEADAAAAIADDRLKAAQKTESEARNAEQAARDATAQADTVFEETRDRAAEIKERAAGQVSLLASLQDQLVDIATDLEYLETEEKDAAEALGAIPDADGPRRKIADLREELAQRRSLQVECQSRFDTLERAAEERAQRLAAIDAEAGTWNARIEAAKAQLRQLDERRQSLEQEIERLAARPAEINEQRQSLLGAVEKAEQTRKAMADTLARAEHALAEADKNLRAAEAALASARENMVRAEGQAEQAKQSCLALAERIRDRLECRPDQLFEISEIKPGADLPDVDAIERKVDRLNRERETMGPVNLRAETEAEEMKEQIDTMVSEREDLLKAIDKLRRGISELNREGRQRLLTSFAEVNKHFQELFVQLFGGGRAHLELTESDDPLDAGLEIMASPPGKRLQVLSLLSGGEQALTALALLFAVFQTNPAPICVLDEVDAPLDDANVDRFCTLVEKMASTDTTRFLIITHHRMTMARMDRLYGVTMTERGVSQLVSVDLHRADELRATA